MNNPVKKIVEKDLVLKKYIKIESVKREESEINAKEENEMEKVNFIIRININYTLSLIIQ